MAKKKENLTDILPPMSDLTTIIAAPNLSIIVECKEVNSYSW